MQRIIFLISAFLVNLSIYAQAGGVTPANRMSVRSQMEIIENDEILNRFLRGVYTSEDTNIEGSPYLNDEFLNGGVIFKENTLAAQIRYNVAKEQMEVLLKGKKYALQDGLNVTIEDKNYSKLEYIRDGKNYVGYFEIITAPQNGGIVLMNKSLKKIRPGQAAGAMRPATPPKYADQSDFYLQINNSKPVLVERRKNKFLKIFPQEHREMIKSYMKKNKLSSGNEEDLIKIVTYYNSNFIK